MGSSVSARPSPATSLALRRGDSARAAPATTSQHGPMEEETIVVVGGAALRHASDSTVGDGSQQQRTSGGGSGSADSVDGSSTRLRDATSFSYGGQATAMEGGVDSASSFHRDVPQPLPPPSFAAVSYATQHPQPPIWFSSVQRVVSESIVSSPMTTTTTTTATATSGLEWSQQRRPSASITGSTSYSNGPIAHQGHPTTVTPPLRVNASRPQASDSTLTMTASESSGSTAAGSGYGWRSCGGQWVRDDAAASLTPRYMSSLGAGALRPGDSFAAKHQCAPLDADVNDAEHGCYGYGDYDRGTEGGTASPHFDSAANSVSYFSPPCTSPTTLGRLSPRHVHRNSVRQGVAAHGDITIGTTACFQVPSGRRRTAGSGFASPTLAPGRVPSCGSPQLFAQCRRVTQMESVGSAASSVFTLQHDNTQRDDLDSLPPQPIPFVRMSPSLGSHLGGAGQVRGGAGNRDWQLAAAVRSDMTEIELES